MDDDPSRENNPNWNLIRSLIFVGLMGGIVCWVIYSRGQRTQSIHNNPAWAVAYFDGIKTGYKRVRYASYLFQVNGKNYYARESKDRVTYLDGRAWPNCFPVVYCAKDTDNHRVILDSYDLYQLDLQLPDSIEAAVYQAEHVFELAARPYPFNTRLKGDYYLRYDFTDISKYLTLMSPRGDTIKKVLVAGDASAPFSNLGYILADFNNYFVLAHGDSGQVRHIQLFDKHTGDNLLGTGAVWIDGDIPTEQLVYRIDGDEDIVICSADTTRKETYRCPKDAQQNSLQLETLAPATLALTYKDATGRQRKITYNRVAPRH